MSTIAARPLEPLIDIDLTAKETRANWRELAAEWATQPPFYVVNHDLPQLVVPRYADNREVFLDTERFQATKPATASARFDPFRGLPHIGRLDGEAHDRVKRLLQPSFGGAAVRGYEGQIQLIVDELLDEIEAAGPEFDAVSQFTEELIPRFLLGYVFGLEESQQQVLLRMNDQLETVHEVGSYTEEYEAAFDAALALTFDIIAERKARPDASDFIGGLVAGRERGEPVEDEEIAAHAFTILVAAVSTTATTGAMTLLAWMRHRDQFELLHEEPKLLPMAVEESLRLHPAGLFVRSRFAGEDTVLGGTTVWKGTPIHRCPAAANLDPTVYENPLAFDVRRNPKHTMTFGAGPHFCAGAILARRILCISLETVMRRFPGLQLVDPDFEPSYHGQLGELKPDEMRMRLA